MRDERKTICERRISSDSPSHQQPFPTFLGTPEYESYVLPKGEVLIVRLKNCIRTRGLCSGDKYLVTCSACGPLCVCASHLVKGLHEGPPRSCPIGCVGTLSRNYTYLPPRQVPRYLGSPRRNPRDLNSNNRRRPYKRDRSPERNDRRPYSNGSRRIRKRN